MQCALFHENITEYLDCSLARPARREFCEHLLACRPCHLLFNDVREGIDGCHEMTEIDVREEPVISGVEQRVLSATTAGEMLSCLSFDALLSDYFDGLIENSYEQLFNEHFAVCNRCRRLVDGVRESIDEQEPIDVPDDLHERIFAATSRAASGGRR